MTDMIELKTAELVGPALDWAVAEAEGHEPLVVPTGRAECSVGVILAMDDGPKGFACRPSTDWSQGGPLIEKHNVQLLPPGREWEAQTDMRQGPSFWAKAFGSTALIAACRAIVAAKLGDTVRVPAALVGGEA